MKLQSHQPGREERKLLYHDELDRHPPDTILLPLFRSFFEVRLTPRKWGHLQASIKKKEKRESLSPLLPRTPFFLHQPIREWIRVSQNIRLKGPAGAAFVTNPRAEAGAATKEAAMNGFSCCTKRRGEKGIHLRLSSMNKKEGAY